jgi:hypothetical protein
VAPWENNKSNSKEKKNNKILKERKKQNFEK